MPQQLDGGNLLARTLKLLESIPKHISYATIAKDIDVSPAWLSALSRNVIPDPGIKKIQRLHDWLITPRPSDKLTFQIVELRACLSREEKRNCVYVVWAGSICLYVGCSYSIRTRLLNHTRMAEFLAHSASHIDITFFDGEATDFAIRSQAFDTERDYIAKLRPKLNYRGTSNKKRRALP